jgi:hypothetical protein
MMQTIGRDGFSTAPDLSTLNYYTYDDKDEKEGRIPPGAMKGDLAPEKWKPEANSNCQSRLKFLRELGYIDYFEERTTRKEGLAPYLYFLTKKGARALADYLSCDVEDLAWRKIKPRECYALFEPTGMLGVGNQRANPTPRM